MQNKPFVLLGVNSDQDRAALKPVLEKEKITWRSFWNGGSTDGPISRMFKVTGWPTLILIDAKGVIRNVWRGAPPAETLDKAIDKVVKEASASAKQ